MIIVSQDKSGIVNFDEVFRLYADNWSDEDFPMEPNCFCIRAEKSGDHMTSVFLGEYETMKRAKEVLQEIWEFYEISKRYECSSNNSITIFIEPKFAYQMPER